LNRSKCFFGVDTSGAQAPLSAMARNDGGMVNKVGLSRKHIFDAVEASVKRLGTYIDVLQIHRLDRDTPREEIMRALNDVVESGMVRYIGASSVSSRPFLSYLHLINTAGLSINSPQVSPTMQSNTDRLSPTNRWQPGSFKPSKP
jgi:versiconal hemiacetal acetate reductase